MAAKRRVFPASKVSITRVYLVDCEACGAVNLALGDAPTRPTAQRLKREHVEWHRQQEREAADGD